MRKICLTLVVYAIMSALIFISDVKEPQYVIYDIARPVENEEDKNDTPVEEIAPMVTYMKLPDEGVFYRESFYAPEMLTGIELWLECNDTIKQDYTIIFYNQWWETIYSHKFSSDDITRDGFTRIIFENCILAEGELYFFTIEPLDYSTSDLALGVISSTSYWSEGLYVGEALVPGIDICFNLIYNYQRWGFINWLVLNIVTMLFLLWEKHFKDL